MMNIHETVFSCNDRFNEIKNKLERLKRAEWENQIVEAITVLGRDLNCVLEITYQVKPLETTIEQIITHYVQQVLNWIQNQHAKLMNQIDSTQASPVKLVAGIQMMIPSQQQIQQARANLKSHPTGGHQQVAPNSQSQPAKVPTQPAKIVSQNVPLKPVENNTQITEAKAQIRRVIPLVSGNQNAQTTQVAGPQSKIANLKNQLQSQTVSNNQTPKKDHETIIQNSSQKKETQQAFKTNLEKLIGNQAPNQAKPLPKKSVQNTQNLKPQQLPPSKPAPQKISPIPAPLPAVKTAKKITSVAQQRALPPIPTDKTPVQQSVSSQKVAVDAPSISTSPQLVELTPSAVTQQVVPTPPPVPELVAQPVEQILVPTPPPLPMMSHEATPTQTATQQTIKKQNDRGMSEDIRSHLQKIRHVLDDSTLFDDEEIEENNKENNVEASVLNQSTVSLPKQLNSNESKARQNLLEDIRRDHLSRLRKVNVQPRQVHVSENPLADAMRRKVLETVK